MRGIILVGALLLAGAAQAFDFNQYDGAESNYSLSDLTALLNSDQAPASLEEVLASARAASPGLFRNYVLVYRSRSIQGANRTFPRAILYNRDASFLMAFNGHHMQRGYDRLEVMQFNAVDSHFEFHEVSVKNGRAWLGPANPPLCLSCHQSRDRKDVDPRPNWEPYDRWPGVIGSDNNFNPAIFQKEDRANLIDSHEEDQMLTDWLVLARGNSRYKNLALDISPAKIKENPHDLTELLGRLNFRRVMRLVRDQNAEHYSHVDKIFQGAVQCQKLWIAPEALAVLEQKTPTREQEFVVDNKNLIRNRDRSYPHVMTVRDGGPGEKPVTIVDEAPEYPTPYMSEIIYMLFESYGVDISDWSMDFGTYGRLAFAERFGVPSFPAQDAMLGYNAVFPEKVRDNCDDIRRAALRQSGALLKLPNIPAVAHAPLINDCVRCHASVNSTAPYIPFDRPTLLKGRLQQKMADGRTLLEEIEYRLGDFATQDEQMPKGLKRPSRQERQALINFLQGL
jgi:hypothetical protein